MLFGGDFLGIFLYEEILIRWIKKHSIVKLGVGIKILRSYTLTIRVWEVDFFQPEIYVRCCRSLTRTADSGNAQSIFENIFNRTSDGLLGKKFSDFFTKGNLL